ncbi:MAG: hypothetical protein RLZZ410_1583 [Pseudomonadota bacterium]|jgi:hypothetical protein
MKRVDLISRFVCCVVIGVFAGCGKPLSPQAQAFANMQKAICKNYNLADAVPYVTESSKPMLELTASFAVLGSALGGGNLQDEFAKECANSKLSIIDEIRVNDKRYIIRYKENSGAMKEAIVVLENGQWKVALAGK